MKSYINEFSWKCLLGPQSKNLSKVNDIYLWDVGKKKHFCTNKTLSEEDFDLIDGRSFHYLNIDNFNYLKSKLMIDSKDKNISTYIDLTKFDLSGSKYRKVRQTINKAKKYNLVIKDNFDKIEDVKEFIEQWSNNLAVKYFRDFSGKNFYFYKNNFHKDCINVFIYDKNELVAFATSSPNLNDRSSYIIGKALCNKYSGLSELADSILYEKCLKAGIKEIDLGQTTGGLVFYKNKFPGADNYTYFNGKCKLKV